MRTALAFAMLALMGGRAVAETPADALTRGKLEADMGRLQAAAAAFEEVAHASEASPEQRSEALVRLGVARRSAGDFRGSAEAFEETWTTYRHDPEAIRFLLQALGSALPGQERWDEVWEKIVFSLDRTHPERPIVNVAWPGASRIERAGVRQTMSVDFKEGNLVDIFRLLADVSGLNVVVQPGVWGKVTFSARDLPWDELLEKVLAPYGFLGRIDGNVLWIGRPGEAPRADGAGDAIDVDFASVPLRDVLVEVAARGGARAVIPDGVAGQVTIRLRAVPWLQAFDLIATANGLVWERRGDVITVRPQPRP
jgi:hypothetical protein